MVDGIDTPPSSALTSQVLITQDHTVITISRTFPIARRFLPLRQSWIPVSSLLAALGAFINGKEESTVKASQCETDVISTLFLERPEGKHRTYSVPFFYVVYHLSLHCSCMPVPYYEYLSNILYFYPHDLDFPGLAIPEGKLCHMKLLLVHNMQLQQDA